MRRLVAVVAAALATVVSAPATYAGTVTVNGSTLVFQAASGEANDLSVITGNPLTVRDAVPITAGPGCSTTANANEVTCTSAGVSLLDVHTGDLADRVNMDYAFIAATIDGGPGHDNLNGSSLGDTVNGADGNDTVHGGLGGNDVLHGGPGDDSLDGLIGSDQYYGGDGDDVLIRAAGGIWVANVLSGGEGVDLASYRWVYNSVSITLDDVANDGPSGVGDNVMADVENLVGGSANDTIVGDGDANVLDGEAGHDTLLGGGGRDTVTYASRLLPVFAEAGGPSGVAGEADLIGGDVEGLIGGSSNDVLIGGAGDGDLVGGGGNDLLDGGPGSDVLDGGPGDGDVIDYSERVADLTVDLVDEADDGEAGENDTLRGFEEIWGGSGDDSLSGSSSDDILDGGLGADAIDGGPGEENGADLVDYSDRGGDVFADLDGVVGDDGEASEGDTLSADLESLVGGSGDDELGGNARVNQVIGGSGDDLLAGGLGADELDGGPGIDGADYSSHTSGVNVDIGGPLGNDGSPGEGDTVGPSIEDLIGGFGSDVLTGDDRNNLLFGGPGNDELRGADADDVLNGGTGADLLVGGYGFDLADYAERTTGVSVDLDGATADDGAPGEGDSIASDVEDIGGGAGPDLLIGDNGENFLFGRGGNDVLDGGANSDVMSGGSGDDTLFASDYFLDEALCGDGTADQVVADWLDKLDACERISRPTPDVATGPASAVTRTTARLSAAVNPKGNATTVHWEYGPTAAYGSRTPNVNLPANAGSTTVITAISVLTPGTTYHYRAVATNGGGTEYGVDLTFTTLAPPQTPPVKPPPPRLRPCIVARVVGQPLRVARRWITQRRCRVGRITRRPSRVVRAGIVLAQRPKAGRRLPRGSKVSLVVSSGKPRTSRKRR
jgi:Ca2+-binding RTX toxin-like protein